MRHPVLYLPNNQFGFKHERSLGLKQRPEFGIEVKVVEASITGFTKLVPTKMRFLPAKDYQQKRVYEAEYPIRPDEDVAEFAQVDFVRQYVEHVWTTLGMRDTLGKVTPTVVLTAKRNTASASVWSHEIKIPKPKHKWAYGKIVILHEITHLLCPSGESHGPMFVRTMKDMVSKFIGIETADRYEHNCRRLWSRDYVEMAGAKFGLARFGPATGFTTGVAHDNIVSPHVSGVRVERDKEYQPWQ